MPPEKYAFKTEVNQLLDLMIHSLYSHKEVSIREIVSNASDAIDKARYESLTNPDVMVPKEGWKIRIRADKDVGTLTISDNGIGMTREEAIEALGTIAHSGTKEFLAALKKKNMENSPDLIGQFGVGFYSSFMIADKVTLLSRKAAAKDDTGIKWESTADGSFLVEDAAIDTPGTDVILHIKEDEKKYLDEWQIRDVVSKYSDYIEYPIVMDVVREEDSALEKGKKVKVQKEEQINSGKALWLRDRTDIPENEYNEFYKHISHDFSDPMKVIHYHAEGTSEFTCLLYVPAHAPLDIFYKEFRIGPALYVKKVQIMDHCEELIPPYLRFIKGIVDSSDLPLNVSREILQNNRQVTVMKNNITKRVLDTLAEMKKNDGEKFRTFSRQFGRVLKEGIHYDHTRKETIAGLLLFSSTASGEAVMRTLDDYVASMKEGQTDIYYMTGTSFHDMGASPYLEVFREKAYEVLFLTDDIDDLIFSAFEYKGKKFKSILKGDINLESTATKSKADGQFDKLIDFMKTILGDDVKEVRLSGRLRDSPCCLVGDEGDLDPRMEKMLKAMGQEVPVQKKVLEINPDHPIIASMKELLERDGTVPLLEEYSRLLLDQALLLSGTHPKDPARFSRYLSHLMVEGAKCVSPAEKPEKA